MNQPRESSIMDTTHRATREQFALKLSIAANLFQATLGFGFAVFTHSEAILLDGIFSITNFVIAIVTLIVSQVVQRPDDDLFHFGYGHFEPLLNAMKALIITTICIFALLSSINQIRDGGQALATGYALIYAVVASVSCLIVAGFMRHYARTSQSQLVAFDAKNWLIDGMISGAVFLAFVAVLVLERTSWSPYMVYADPSLVVILVLIAIPIPLKILKANMREVLMMAPPEALQDEISRRFHQVIAPYGFLDTQLRMLKTGRHISVLAHVLVPEHFRLERVSELDTIHHDIMADLQAYHAQLYIDIVFTEDRQLLEQ